MRHQTAEVHIASLGAQFASKVLRVIQVRQVRDAARIM